MNKPDSTPSANRKSQATELGPTLGDALPGVHVNFFQLAWARVRSWFEIPFGYEDETGFHYGHEPAPIHSTAGHKTLREVFTDRACDSAMFMAATSTETSPIPAPKQTSDPQRENRKLTVNHS